MKKIKTIYEQKRKKKRPPVGVIVVDELGETELFHAVWEGDLETVKVLLKSTPFDPNQRNLNGQSVVHRASIKGHVEILEYLLSHGYDANSCDVSFSTPLTATLFPKSFPLASAGINDICIQVNQRQIVETLINYGADLNVLDGAFETALTSTLQMHSAICGDPTIPSLLIQHGAKIKMVNCDGFSPLCLACAASVHPNLYFFPDLVRLILAAGANVRRLDPWVTDPEDAYVLAIKKVDSDLVHELEYQYNNPQTLLNQCRLVIRNMYENKLWLNIDLLPLPRRLKDFLKLKS